MGARAAAIKVGVLVMAHGTPAHEDEVAAFYTEIRRGRPPSDEQWADLVRRYRAIGGISPLTATTAAQVAGITAALAEYGDFVVRWGARFSPPRIAEALDELRQAGAAQVVALVLTPHSSHVSVAEYERLARAGAGEMALEMIEHWYDAPGFDALVARRVTEALDSLADADRSRSSVIFTAHSVPTAVLRQGDTYDAQVTESARAVAGIIGLEDFDVAWQSAGRTDDQWLGPDVGDVIAERAAQGASAVVVCPIGFVADHLEVLYDIDIEAHAVADGAGIAFARTASFNASPDFCRFLAEVVERAARRP